jgi:hypothetical protein
MSPAEGSRLALVFGALGIMGLARPPAHVRRRTAFAVLFAWAVNRTTSGGSTRSNGTRARRRGIDTYLANVVVSNEQPGAPLLPIAGRVVVRPVDLRSR